MKSTAYCQQGPSPDSNQFWPGQVFQHQAMNANALSQLQRKLQALHYTDPLDHSSAPLAQKLVDDLLQATESYRGMKLQSAARQQELEQNESTVRCPDLAVQVCLHCLSMDI